MILIVQVFQTWNSYSGPDARYANFGGDFKAFYCAGAAANRGENPYLTDPLDRCGAVRDAQIPSYARTGVAAAPLPTYDIAVFRLFALLPYPMAAVLWLVLSVIALSLAIIVAARLSALSPVLIFASIAIPLYYLSLEWGQLPPFLFASTAFAAYALQRSAYRSAGIACVLTMIEPHLGVPVCIAAMAWAPRTRSTISLGVTALALIGVASAGLLTNFEYFKIVLPLHAMSEIPAGSQYSLTWLSYFLGAPSSIALKVGTLSYVFMAVLGIITSRNVARASQVPALIPVVPAAFIVLGGTFVHLWQISISILLAVILIGISRRATPLLWLSLLLQAPLWGGVAAWTVHPITLVRIESTLAVAVIAYFAARYYQKNCLTALLVSLIGAVLYFGMSTIVIGAPLSAVRISATAANYDRALGSNRRYASGTWGTYIRSLEPNHVSSVRTLLEKVPRWIGLLLLVIATLRFKDLIVEKPGSYRPTPVTDT
ncbi:MAG: hypothetical protein NVS2B3_03650 [Vulcanimicrobiaceae bacterium]